MKIVRMTAFNNLTILEDKKPETASGEALIRVKYAGICASDLMVLQGRHPAAHPPLIPGHEFCGELAEIRSPGGAEYKIGDTVSAHPLSSCGRCEQCRRGKDNLCRNLSIFGVHQDGCYSEYRKVPIHSLVKIDSAVEMEIAALVEPFAVAVHDLRRSGMQMGDSICIIGAGTIGILIALAAKLAGAEKIVLSEIDEMRRTLATEMGFTVFDPRQGEFAKQMMDVSGGRGFDRVFEVSGSQEGYEAALNFAKTGGTLVMVGFPGGPLSLDLNPVILKEFDLLGVRIHTYSSFKTAADIISSGMVSAPLRKMISRVYSLDKIHKAFFDAKSDKSIIKALIRFY